MLILAVNGLAVNGALRSLYYSLKSVLHTVSLNIVSKSVLQTLYSVLLALRASLGF